MRKLQLEDFQPSSGKLELLVGSRDLCRNSSVIETHYAKDCFPRGSFRCVRPAVFMPSPELSYLQMAQILTQPQLIQYGIDLCAKYYREPLSRSLVERPPLTNLQSLARYLDRAKGLRGTKRAKATLPFIAEGSASPMETKCYLLLRLPLRVGGYGLSGLMLNHRVDPGRDRAMTEQGYFSIDICIPSKKVGIEYYGEKEHPDAIRDRRRLDALEALGWHMTVIDKQRLYSMAAFDKAALQIHRHLGKRIRRDVARWQEAAAALRKDLLL